VKSMVAALAPWTAAVRLSSIRGKSRGPSMPRCIVILTLVLQAVFTRLAVSQDSLPDTLLILCVARVAWTAIGSAVCR